MKFLDKITAVAAKVTEHVDNATQKVEKTFQEKGFKGLIEAVDGKITQGAEKARVYLETKTEELREKNQAGRTKEHSVSEELGLELPVKSEIEEAVTAPIVTTPKARTRKATPAVKKVAVKKAPVAKKTPLKTAVKTATKVAAKKVATKVVAKKTPAVKSGPVKKTVARKAKKTS